MSLLIGLVISWGREEIEQPNGLFVTNYTITVAKPDFPGRGTLMKAAITPKLAKALAELKPYWRTIKLELQYRPELFALPFAHDFQLELI